MPTHLNDDCPYCLTRGAGFEVQHQWASLRGALFANLLAVCGICKGGMAVLSESHTGTHSDLVRHDIPFPSNKFAIRATWPKYVGQCPASAPPVSRPTSRGYNQGLENMAGGRWDAAGAMFRKCLDVGTKLIAPDKRSKALFIRINELVAEGRLTEAMGEWSHEIRLDGNDAVHDEEPETEADALITQRFTEAFLTYSFTLPAMVEANRAKRT